MKKTAVIAAALAALALLLYLLVPRTPDLETRPVAEQDAALGSGEPQSNRVRVLVAPGDPTRGPADALVTLVTFCDFASQACKRTARSLLEARLAFPAEVRVVFKPFPGPDSSLASEAALAAHEQGKFWEMHDLLFLEQAALAPGVLTGHAQRLGLDVATFRARLDSRALRPAVEEALAYGEQIGVGIAPALFVNGLPVQDAALPFVQLKPRIEAEIARSRSRMVEQDLSAAEIHEAVMREARPRLPER